MKNKKHILSASAAAVILLLFIVDTTTAFKGAAEGVDLCIKAIIPSLFPFFIVTTYLNASLLGLHIPGLYKLGKLLYIPAGGESLLLLGLIGGYPVGAQFIADSYRQGTIDKRTGQILLGYCSNAGPAFIFGVTGTLFSSQWIPFFLWLIHLFSAVITGFLLPRPEHTTIAWKKSTDFSLVQAVQKSIMVCATICGWVIIFKTLMAYIRKWLSTYLTGIWMVCLNGLLELSNGCLMLSQLQSEAVRFILCAVFLAFGGICVILQTLSATESLGLGLYIPGKIIQTGISLLSALALAHLLFPRYGFTVKSAVILPLAVIPVVFGLKIYTKKVVEID